MPTFRQDTLNERRGRIRRLMEATGRAERRHTIAVLRDPFARDDTRQFWANWKARLALLDRAYLNAYTEDRADDLARLDRQLERLAEHIETNAQRSRVA